MQFRSSQVAESCYEDPREPYHAVVNAMGQPITKDAWLQAKLSYAADDDGRAKGAVVLKIGRTQSEIDRRTILVYDFSGVPVACAVISAILRVVAVSGDGTLIYGRQAPRLSQLGLTGLDEL